MSRRVVTTLELGNQNACGCCLSTNEKVQMGAVIW